MRIRASVGCVALLALSTAAHAESRDVALLFRFDAAYSRLSIEAMKQELAPLAPAYRFQWQLLDQSSASDVRAAAVVVRFRGSCKMTGVAEQVDRAPGPFAWTHVVDGKPLRFVEVDCDRLRASLFSVMWGEDFQHRDFLLGRALARVLVHELRHSLERKQEHTDDGLTKPKLTGRELIADVLPARRRGFSE